MAEKKLQVVVGVSSKAFKEGLRGINKDIKDAQREWKRDFGAIQQSLEDTAKKMAIVGAAITAVAGKSIADFAKLGEEIDNFADKTGFSTETISKLKYAAEATGASLDTVETAVKGMANMLETARTSTSGTSTALNTLGIKLSDLQGLNPEEQFMKLATSVAAVQGPLQRAALAQDVFGLSGMDLLPMLSSGAAGLAEMGDEAKKMGLVLDDAAVAKAKAAEDAINRMKSAVNGVKIAIGEALTPALVAASINLTDLISKLTDWTQKHPELINQITKLGLALVGGAGLLMALSQVSKAITLLFAAGGPGGWVVLGASLIAAAVAYKLAGDMLETAEQKMEKTIRASIEARKAIMPDVQYSGANTMIEGMVNEGEKTDIEVRAALYAEKWRKYEEQVAADIAANEAKVTTILQDELDKRMKAQQDYLSGEMKALDSGVAYWKDAEEKITSAINDTYGTKVKDAQSAHDKVIALLDAEGRKAQETANKNISAIREEYAEKERLYDIDLRHKKDAIDDQISAIDSQSEADKRAKEDADRATTLSGLIQNTVLRGTEADWQALADFQEKTSRINLERQRADAKNNLQQQKEDLDRAAAEQRDIWNVELASKVQHETDILNVELERLADSKAAQDIAFTENINRMEKERLAFVQAENEKYAALIRRLELQQQGLAGDVPTDKMAATFSPGAALQGFYRGGLITTPTLLTRLGDRQPFGIMAENGAERISSARSEGYKTANLTIMLNGRILARALGQPLVDEIKYQTGLR